MRTFLWVALGKGCIRMRQDRAESDVVQDTLFGFFSEKGGLKCDSVRRENYNKAFKWLGSRNFRGGAYDKLKWRDPGEQMRWAQQQWSKLVFKKNRAYFAFIIIVLIEQMRWAQQQWSKLVFKKNRAYFAFIIIVLIGIWLVKPGEEPTTEDDFSNLVRINPVPQVQELVQQEKFAEANDYLSYFMDYDYVNQDPQAIQLHSEIQDTRDDWLYKLKKTNSGFWTGESDETEGQVAAVVSDFLVIGDIRDLGREGKNFIEGKDVDEVTAALSGVGVVAAGAALVTAGTAATAKPAVSFLKMANKAGKMPKWLGKYLVESAEIAKKTKNLDHVAGLFSDIQGLYKTAGAHSTLELLGKSKNLDDFRRLAKFGNAFGAKTSTLLKIAGDDAITVYQRFGNASKNTFLEASTFGNDGVKAFEKHGSEKFQKFLETEKTSNARRRMTNLEKQIVESGRKAKFSGQDFIKRDELFESTFVDATGRSNVDRMKQGLAPLGKDGNPINLHHMKQQSSGIIAEVSHTEHKEYSDVLHRYAGKNESEIDRADFDKLRSAYWKDRVKEFN